ncbi:helix-turn-helix domain-containing protein [Candidatus Woesearchaeota archaeon]|nr:helix-turn-helix domain-containing protein [Candidatus Woesearchaeota archaeon]
MTMTAQQKHKLKKFVKELEACKAAHTEFVTVYIPAGYDINKIINHLGQEQGTAMNIKSAATRKNVTDALERMIQHLKLFKQTPPNGLAVFAGNVLAREGKTDVKVWSIEPPVPLNTRIYKCDKYFEVELLRDMLDVKEMYGLVVLDRRDAALALLKGKSIVPLLKTHSHVPGKMKAGGQCLTADSVVQLSDGLLPEIKNVHNSNKVKSMVDFSLQDSAIKDKWTVKKDQVYTVITKYPRLEVQASKDHIFFVSTNKGIVEKPAEQLKKDDILIMPEEITVAGRVQKIFAKQYYNSFSINQQGRNLLLKKRKEKKLLQKQLAKKLKLTQTAISFIELGKVNVGRDVLKRVCDGLEIEFAQFLKKYASPCMYKEINLPDKITPKFAQFIGYYLGGGSIEHDRISFFEQRKEVALQYKTLFENLFNLRVSYRFRENKNYHQLRVGGRPLVRLVKNEFPELKLAKTSSIPALILKSKKDVVAAFLKGLFDAEGYVAVSGKVGIGMNNKLVIQQLQMLLLRFSVLSSFLEYNKGNPHSKEKRFSLEISEKKSLEFLMHFIGFTSQEKSIKLDKMLKNKFKRSSVRQMLFPGTKIRKIIEKAGHNLELFPKVNSFFRNERMMGKEVFKNSILSNVKDKRLYKELDVICRHKILPVKIAKIKISKKPSKLIDISVKNKSFIANGLILHNSAHRFEQNRALALKDHLNKVADYMKDEFLSREGLKGIIVGGPGPTKYELVEGNFITGDVKKKIIGMKDLSYTEDFGLQELVDKSEDLLAKEEVVDEKKAMGRFFEKLAKDPDTVSYGEAQVKKALNMGAVETLLVSESLSDDLIDEFEEIAGQFSTEVKIISTETREGVQLRDIGGVAAVLRYKLAA